jgi:membrane fusion protein (multidrug efflux system)
VVQRIPVKIALDSGAPIALRPGMSVIPTVETRARAHASGSSKIAYANSQR